MQIKLLFCRADVTRWCCYSHVHLLKGRIYERKLIVRLVSVL